MKRHLLLIAIMAWGGLIMAQKKEVTLETPTSWDFLKSYGISKNGKYVWYSHGVDNSSHLELILINNKTGQQKKMQASLRTPFFTEDGTSFVFYKSHDSAAILNLATNEMRFLPSGSNLETMYVEKQQLFLIRSGNKLIVINSTTGSERIFDDVDRYLISPNRKSMVIKSGDEIAYVTFPGNEKKIIAAKVEVTSEFSFDESGVKLAFHVKGKEGTEIWIYDSKHDKARKLVNDLTPGIMAGYRILERNIQFSPDGKHIYFTSEKPATDRNTEEVKYHDLQLQIFHFRQLFPNLTAIHTPDRIISVVSTGETPVIKHLTKPGQYFSEQLIKGNKYLLTRSVIIEDESYWNTPIKYCLISLETGVQKEFSPESLKVGAYRFSMSMSPDEKFLIWNDALSNHIFSYEIVSGVIRNSTAGIPLYRDIFFEVGGSRPFSFYSAEPVWVDLGKSFLVFDKYDLWQIDPQAQKKPVNLTNGYGRNNGVEFQFAIVEGKEKNDSKIESGESLLLRAMETKTKKNGIWSVQVGSGIVSKGAMDDCLYQWNITDAPVIIAAAAEVGDYLVTRQTAAASKNVYITKDFKTYKKVSDIAPENEYKWMTSELITYTLKGGGTGLGLLYKPQDFNPTKRYPSIFFYYQSRSNELHQFQVPRINGNMVDIPLYISKGYLVFVPDIINNKPGEIARTTLNSVESAVYHLAQYPWFDSAHIGLNGHSFGGFETNILATNSKLFKAAVAAAGPSNIISQSGSTKTFEGNGLSFSEKGQHNLNAAPWERPDLYIENSPVFQSHKAITPLLLLHGVHDGAVAYDQAYELFQAFRRLQKPAWLFAYKDGDHGVTGSEKATLDLSIRVQQFFDHYLKGEPAPQWLIDGSYSRELNPNGKCSDICPVCKGVQSGM